MMNNEQHKEIRNTLAVAAVDCGHTIDSDRIILQCDPAKPGNALAQLSGRLLDAYLAAACASTPPKVVADERAEVRAFEDFARKACQMPDGIEVNWGALWTQQAYEGWKARAAIAASQISTPEIPYNCAAAPVQAQEAERMNTDQSREYLVQFMQRHFTDKTFHRYILADEGRNGLAGDFAWQMARALRMLATPVQDQEPVAYAWRVGEFWSSANPWKKVLCLAEGDDIIEWAKRKDFIRWVSPTPAQPVAVPDGDAKECLLDVISHHGDFHMALAATRDLHLRGNDSDSAAYWDKQLNVLARMKVQAERALAAPAAQGDAKDAERWRTALRFVGADRSPALGNAYFILRGIYAAPGVDLMRGSAAGHFTDSIDATINAKAAS